MEHEPIRTPDEPAAAGERPERTAPRRRVLVATLLSVAAVGYALDQTTKWLVQANMALGETIDVWPPFLRWHYILNPGAAFSIGTEVTWIFTIVQAAVVVYVFFLLRKLGSWPWALALGGLLAGAAGNLTDRLFREPSFGMGHVVDFISVPNFAIFNIADSLVVCSMIAICLMIFKGLGIDGRPADAEPSR